MTYTLVLLGKYIGKKHELSQKKKNASKNNSKIGSQNRKNEEDQITRKSEPIKFNKLEDENPSEVAELEIRNSQEEVKIPNKKSKKAF